MEVHISTYHYSIDCCDVEDKANLKRFRAERTEWYRWLHGDEHHAIWTNLHNMVWREVAFRTLADIAVSNVDSALNNVLIKEAVINGHQALQVLAIRRLIDTTRGVQSVTKLLQNIRKHSGLLTRENIVSYDGLPYHYQELEEAHYEAQFANRTGTGGWGGSDRTGPTAFEPAKLAHAQFDRLSGIAAENRKRTDRLPKQLICEIETWIANSGAKEWVDWCDNFLAHAGPPERRAEALNYDLGIDSVIKNLAEVVEAVSVCLFDSPGNARALMAMAGFNQFELLDNAALTSANSVVLGEVWNKLSLEFDASLDRVEEKLISGIYGSKSKG